MANTSTIEHPHLKEWGADAEMQNRPGVPMEKEIEVLPSGLMEFQEPRVPVIHKHAGREDLTPVFGTAQPPHGLSGQIRRAAYKIPDNRMSHWMLLMLGDRVDIAESAVMDVMARPSVGLFMTLGAAALAIQYLRRRERFV